MSIKSDNWIIEQSKKHELITPFLEEQVREASGNKLFLMVFLVMAMM